LTLDIKELLLLYPTQTKVNILRRKREYAKRIRDMERLNSNPNIDNLETKDEYEVLAKEFNSHGINLTAEELSKATRAGFHIGYIRNSEGEIEYTKPLPHVEFNINKNK